MNIRISRLDDVGGDFDTKTIEIALEQDAMDEMTPFELEVKNYTEVGIIPKTVAHSQASSFGLRKAYLDVWKPIDSKTSGIWHLQKDADGKEWIVRADGE